MERRAFLLRLPVLSAGVAVGAATVPLGGCGGSRYLVPLEAGDRLTIPLSSLPDGADAFLQTPAMERPVWVRRKGDDVVALLARCTHRGCQPEPVGDRLSCPCHGSEFSLTGEVLEGPAERPLIRFAAAIEGDEVIVRLHRRVG
jgi:cytochrome b6-f complex iron-sulfur subunit